MTSSFRQMFYYLVVTYGIFSCSLFLLNAHVWLILPFWLLLVVLSFIDSTTIGSTTMSSERQKEQLLGFLTGIVAGKHRL